MPIQRYFYPRENYTRSVYVPPIDNEERVASVEAVPRHPDFRPSMHFLIDRRQCAPIDYSDYTVEEVKRLFDWHVEIAQGHKVRIALLGRPPDRSGQRIDQMFLVIAELYRDRLSVRDFEDEAEALAWILEAPTVC